MFNIDIIIIISFKGKGKFGNKIIVVFVKISVYDQVNAFVSYKKASVPLRAG